LNAYVLLDAQDWMNDATLTELWRQIRRTARPGARVIFRTAADEPLLPGRVPTTSSPAFATSRAGAAPRAARPLLDLRRVPSMDSRMSAAHADPRAAMDRMYRRQRQYLRSHPQVLPARPRRTHRRPEAGARRQCA